MSKQYLIIIFLFASQSYIIPRLKEGRDVDATSAQAPTGCFKFCHD